jgi:hypothetical protein
VEKTVSIEATATDDTALYSLQIYVDGALVGATTYGTLAVSWNTRKATTGDHTISARAEDLAGNVTQATITVTVAAPAKGGGGAGGGKDKPGVGKGNGKSK